jgi:hypothetical protein
VAVCRVCRVCRIVCRVVCRVCAVSVEIPWQCGSGGGGRG